MRRGKSFLSGVLPAILLCVVVCATLSAQEARWWREIPEKTLFRLGPDFSTINTGDVEAQGKWQLVNVEGGLAPYRTGMGPALAESGRGVLTLTTKRAALKAPCAIEADVRLTPNTVAELFTVSGAGAAEEPLARLSLTSSARNPFEVGVGASILGNNLISQILHNPSGWLANLETTTQTGAWAYSASEYDRYSLRPDSTRWPEAVRKASEAELSRIPDFFHRWTLLRIECLEDAVRFYVDSRFIAEGPCARAGERVGLRLQRGGALRSLSVREIARTDPGFYPVDLQGQFNAQVRGAVCEAGSLPSQGCSDVQGTPFRFSGDGPVDSVDVGPSRWRWGRDTMSREAQHFASALHADPCEIKVAVPNRFYSELRLICFSEESRERTRTLTTRLFEPPHGYAADFATEVPPLNATSVPGAVPLPVTLARGGRKAEGRVWLVRIPLDPCRAKDFIADPALPSLNIEFTKAVHLIRSYPDPFMYDKFPVGPPSGVHILAATLVRTPVEIRVEPEKPCWLFERPETPTFRLTLRNFLAPAHEARVRLEAREFYGGAASREFRLAVPAAGPVPTSWNGAGASPQEVTYTLALPVEQDGHYKLTVEVSGPNYALRWPTSFVMLPPDTRRAWGWNSPFGVWRAHHRGMPVEWQAAFDRRVGIRWAGPHPDAMPEKLRHEANLTPAYDIGIHAKFQPDLPDKGVQALIAEAEDNLRYQRSRASVYNLYWEDAVSLPLNVCVPPEFMGQPEQKMDAEESARFDLMWETANRFGAMVREKLPTVEPRFKDKKIALGNTSATFLLPFIKRGFPKKYMDFFGLDIPFFERMPERPPRAIELNELYFLKETAKKYGYSDVPLCGTEYMAYPSAPGSLTEYEAACYTVRNFTIAMAAYNVRYFFSASCVAQAGNWYGRQHYGGSGYLRRAPELNPMPAAAAYATYTRIFDSPRPDTWVVHKTGSLSAFAASCLRMFRPGRAMALWALRGERPATIVLSRDAEAIVTRMTGRSERVNSKDRRIEVTLRPDPVYVELPTISNASDIASIELGQPTYAERPAEGAKVVEDFERGFAWQPSDERRVSYETNKITEPRFKGKLLFTHAGLTGRDGMGLRCELPLVASNQWHTANVAPLYTILRHTGGGIELPGRPFDSAQGRPELVEGRPTKIGFWCRGNSSWARIIPVLVDAKGERWTFIGNPLKGKYKAEAEQAEIAAKGGDGWNSEDMHSWSAVNHDGWRYMEMELPSTFAGDKARGPGQVWWREDLPSPAEAGYAKAGGGDNIVDYPLKLVELILEMYTGVVYMGEWVPIQGENAIEIDDITVAYDDPFEGKWEE